MDVAMKSWELDNGIVLVDPVRDELYNYSPERHDADGAGRPWRSDPHHFKHVRVSAVALIKMTMHARSGGELEIMGLMQGYTAGDTIVVTDAFGLPVEGTETRVNAQEDGNEYMVDYLQLSRDQGARQENVVGWYHSHPGYGCWLSGIDVGTEKMQQQYNDPFVAVVVDPHRTISAGRVEIGAFRTFPDGYDPPPTTTTAPAASSETSGSGGGGQTSVPLTKAEDFGAHASKYYALEVSHFKSTLDAKLLALLWSKYWVQTLSQSPWLTNRDYGSRQMLDLASKMREAAASVQRGARGGGPAGGVGPGGAMAPVFQASRPVDLEVDRLAQTSQSVAVKERQGLVATEVKARIFNGLTTPTTTAAASEEAQGLARGGS
ncbi:Mov34/MPN/PAD-1 family protein [Xylariaceae sp. FL0804]|nr:Mov34/MPN/PAD-1 family protein [Xylariaceae sp. FL0804]